MGGPTHNLEPLMDPALTACPAACFFLGRYPQWSSGETKIGLFLKRSYALCVIHLLYLTLYNADECINIIVCDRSELCERREEGGHVWEEGLIRGMGDGEGGDG